MYGDWFKIINVILIGGTNGFFITLMAIKSPSKAPIDKKDDVSIYIGIFIILGITIGALISIPADVRV